MYLMQFRKSNPGPGRWRIIDGKPSPDFELDYALEIADATLNSWKRAHEAFDLLQGDKLEIDNYAFSRFKELVIQTLLEWEEGGRMDPILLPYPLEAVTYALLKFWIDARQAELRLQIKTGMEWHQYSDIFRGRSGAKKYVMTYDPKDSTHHGSTKVLWAPNLPIAQEIAESLKMQFGIEVFKVKKSTHRLGRKYDDSGTDR